MFKILADDRQHEIAVERGKHKVELLTCTNINTGEGIIKYL